MIALASLLFLVAGIVRFAIGERPRPHASPDTLLWMLAALGIVFSSWRLYTTVFSIPSGTLGTSAAAIRRYACLTPDPSLERLGYRTHPVAAAGHAECVLWSESVNESLIRGREITVVEDQTPVQAIVERLRAYGAHIEECLRLQWAHARRNGKHFRDDAKLCLSTDLGEENMVRVYRGSYYLSFLTNELCTMEYASGGARPAILFDGGSRLFPSVTVNGGDRLQCLDDSRMGSHIGVSTIGLTSGGWLIFWRQRTSAQQSGGTLTPTGSGSCEWSDYVKGDKLHDVVAGAMERELHEESNRGGRDHLVEQTRVVGYFRWIKRGGKPEFVGITKLACPASALKANTDEVDQPEFRKTAYRARNLDELRATLDEVIKEEALSIPLWVNLRLLADALSNPDLRDEMSFLYPGGVGNAATHQLATPAD